MSDDEKRAYAKGYSAGSRGRWPLHKPPRPPDEITAALVDALQALRDQVDGQLAMFDPDDEIVVTLYPFVDAATEALERVGKYCRQP